jgi:ActR/RegA family two-component response regulator
MRPATYFGTGPSPSARSLVVCEPDAPSVFSFPSGRVLLVDDDVAALELWALLLADAGVRVQVAPDAAAALRALDAQAFDLMVIDLRLGDDNGLEVVGRMRARGHRTPFVLVTGEATVGIAVEAMRLGARTVLEKPLIGDALVVPVVRELKAVVLAAAGVDTPLGPQAARRWATFVLRATEAPADPRTLAAWARAAGVSRSVLVESCARLGVHPRDARDLARILRLIRRQADVWNPEAWLETADRRTLRALLTRAGLTSTPQAVRPSAAQFLSMQRFMDQENPGLRELRQMLGG